MSTTNRISVHWLLAGTFLLLMACESYSPPSTKGADVPVPEAQVAAGGDGERVAHVAGIAWFDGSVEEAFAAAKREGRAIYLYWGAVWCPPCQEIKNTVFRSKQFIAQTELFIPVYLDGDTERAQTWGETFGVKGYPTMIVFSPDGEEITRIPGGIDISRYNSILALSLNHMRPTAMLVDLALNNPEALQANDYQQLAYYSWGQDNEALPEGTSPDLFQQLAARVRDSDPESSARLHLQGLVLAAEGAGQDSVSATPKVDASQLRTILASPDLVIACWDYLAYWSEEIMGVLDVEGEERADLMDRWQGVVLASRYHEALSTAEQLGGWLPKLAFFFADEEEGESRVLPDEIIAGIRADGRKASDKTRNAYARQSVVSMITYLFRSARLTEDARQMLLGELDRSASPYYFMSSLASLAEQEGKIPESLEWRRQAYQTSKGKATRFQWGANYVNALVRMRPEDDGKILAMAMEVLDDLAAAGEPFAGRNLRGLTRLNNNLRTWDEGQNDGSSSAVLDGFDARLAALCSEQPVGSQGHTNCIALLAEEEASGAR